MSVLSPELRSGLERAIVGARDAAEAACRVALGVVGVDVERVPEHLGEDDRPLRVALRAEARQLGGFERLVEECAYEQWHRMLFARFLAENELLIHPEHGVAVSIADCEEVALERGIADPWVVASEFASVMLPGIFRPDDPALRLSLAPEGQQALEEILAGLPSDVFTSDDGLGWVYQYWQAKKKNEVNASERKIGGADIAPVTQLFTEHYMVRFLLENTLGAWWAARHPESPLREEWEYLRFDDDGTPAAGRFPGWPETLGEVTVMDPCCGSGHFLVTAFEMMRRMRMEAEGLAPAEAGDAVLRDNLFGLELDPRCTQIAAFALALQAWKTGGYRELPLPNVACSGISAAGRLEDWKKLAAGDERLEASLERLHALFTDAADLGSLIDPLREGDGDLLAAQFSEAAPLVRELLETEVASDPSAAVFGSAAVGAARAGALLARSYTLVVTNPPFLGGGRLAPALAAYIGSAYFEGRADLATALMLRLCRFAQPTGDIAAVTPSNWLYLTSYQRLRERLLGETSFRVVAQLGAGAFRAISGEVVNAALWMASVPPSIAEDHEFLAIDTSPFRGPEEKARALLGQGVRIPQQAQRSNPDARVILARRAEGRRLDEYAFPHKGLTTNDDPRFVRQFWEFSANDNRWDWYQGAVPDPQLWGGRSEVVLFEGGNGQLRQFNSEQARDRRRDLQGANAWGRPGVVVSLVGDLIPTLYSGEKYGARVAAIVPDDPSLIPAIWCYAESGELEEQVRLIDKKVGVTNATVGKVPFDQARWQRAARERYPHGFDAPATLDPTQWLFAGAPNVSNSPLHVAVARILGYGWPRQTGSAFPECAALEPDALWDFVDEDRIVCLPPLRGEGPAVSRLRAVLVAAFGEEWSSEREADVLAEVGYAGKSLELWLRDGFFEQHCQLFHQRPFVWQVWDGRRDGFSALVNYHWLDRATLEKLTYTYLGDWIRQQQAGVEAGAAGSELRLAAAHELQGKLNLILDGASPYDIFIRWKPIEEQPLGWEPDLNDGVRLNIRPFVTAGLLRKNPKVNWNKDRGQDPESAPWYPVFKGDRINDYHLTLADKRAAREAASRLESA